MGYVAAIVALAGAGVSAWGASEQAGAAEDQANAQRQNLVKAQRYADKYYKSVTKDIDKTYDSLETLTGEQWNTWQKDFGGFSSDLEALIQSERNRLANDFPEFQSAGQVEDYWNRSVDLVQRDYDYRTGLARQNVSYALGDSEADLRTAQLNNAALASGDTTAFTNQIKASAYADLATTLGGPVGSFGNLAASSLFSYQNQALSNTLSISDYFSRNGTVDPVSPITTSMQLYEYARGENAAILDLALERYNQGGQITNLELNQLTSLFQLDQQAKASNFEARASNILGRYQQNSNAALNRAQTALGLSAQQASLAGAERYASGSQWTNVGNTIAQLGTTYSNYQNAASQRQLQQNQANYYASQTSGGSASTSAPVTASTK